MPKQMFYNIPEEKRNRFIAVAIEEFTTKSFEQVSVNTIIKKAGISRGSFYTYFTDLESLFNYIMKSTKQERALYAQEIIKESKGDYFKFIRNLFEYDYDSYSQKGTYSLFRNYIHYIQTTKKASLMDFLVKDSFLENSNNDISKAFDISNMRLTPPEFYDLFEIVLIIMVNTINKSEIENMKKDAVIKLFNQRMDLLQHGARRDR